jgi:hypothetical protein
MKTLENIITEIESKGTRNVSFIYNEKLRNATIGANLGKALDKRGYVHAGRDSGFNKKSRSLFTNKKGELVLRVLVNNSDKEDFHFKNFKLSGITDFKCAGIV